VTFSIAALPPAIVRDAAESDLTAILAIHNTAIAESTAIWDTEPADLANRSAWFHQHTDAGCPVLVSETDGRIAGYASYGPFRPKFGYRHTMENSVYLADGFHGQGIATLLMTELLARARSAGVHVMVAGIEAGNTVSIALHKKLGFQTVGQMPEVGRKFNRWLDLTLMQLILD
jgi:L-amino acid N-acyltransferase